MSCDLQLFERGGGGGVGALLMHCFVTGEPLKGRVNCDSWDVHGSRLCLDGR
jgi:hypothetical protein